MHMRFTVYHCGILILRCHSVYIGRHSSYRYWSLGELRPRLIKSATGDILLQRALLGEHNGASRIYVGSLVYIDVKTCFWR